MLVLGGGVALGSAPALAQDTLVLTPQEAAQIFPGPNLLLPVLVGLALAIGFQLLLTHVSVAAGMSAFRFGGNTPDAKPGRAILDPRHRPSFGQRIRRVAGSVGAWTLFSASISLFLACWLAVELSLTTSTVVAGVTALVVWSLFYVGLTGVQAAAARSLAGTLVRGLGGGLRGAWGVTSHALTRSDEARAVRLATRVTRAVKDELLRDGRPAQVRAELQGVVDRLAPQRQESQRQEPDEVRREVEKLLANADLQAVAPHRAGVQWPGPASNSHVDSHVDSHAAGERRVTGKDALNPNGISPEGVRELLERLLVEPAMGVAALREQLRRIDRDSIEAVLAARSDVTPEEAHSIVATVDRWIRAFAEGGSPAKGTHRGAARDEVERRMLAARDEALQGAEEARRTAAHLAWWGVATAVASAIAAVLGGVAAIWV